ncbi:MAG TPA: DUF721 domain-containing protein, partial [Acidimicrobiia bacterium]|nr:DUF721 domain-containing protein [Acidimicrobiia bacterium]
MADDRRRRRGRGRGRRLSRSQVPGEEIAPVPVGEALAAVGEELGIGDPRAVARLERAWGDIVGAVIAEHTRIRSLRRGVLTIAVDGSPWATQLRYLESEIVARADAVVGRGEVSQVRVVVDVPA